MKTKFKKLSDTRVELTVTLDAKDLAPFTEEAVKKLAKEVRVEGFRQGKAPAEVAKKFIPENEINGHTLDMAVRATVIPAFREVEKSPLVMPDVQVTKFVPGEIVEYTATAEIIPEVTLGNYKKLGVKLDAPKITADDVKQMLNNLSEAFAEKKVVKREAKDGDEVIIDFKGMKDGKAFEGGSSKDYHLTLGSKTFIPGFEEGIIGHAAGDKFNLDLTFPKDYGVKDLAGAKTTFEVLVKQVNEVKKAEINDDLAKKCGPFKTLDELKTDIKNNLTAQSQARYDEMLRDQLVKALVDKSKVPVPEILIDDQFRMMKNDLEQNAATQKISVDEYLERNGTNLEDWEKEAKKAAEERVKSSLVMQYLAEKEKITVPEAEVEAKIAELREVYKNSPEAVKNLKDPNVRMDIHNRMVIEKTLDYLVKVNK